MKEQESASERNREESRPLDGAPMLSSELESGKTVVGADQNESNVEASKATTEKSVPK